MIYPKFYIGPMSKNIVDTIITFSNDNNIPIGLIPSRRQVDYQGGYVNNWNTQNFINYIKYKNNNPKNNIILERDHSGPGQGSTWDDGYESLRNDCLGMDIIHIDPWKEYSSYSEGLEATIDMIKFCNSINSNIKFEIGTEESIRIFTTEELDKFLADLKWGLGGLWDKIIYVVIQCGTSLKGTTQTGVYDEDKLIEMIRICKKFQKLSKEHNGDYQSISSINEKFSLGLDAINIAPEFGVAETKTYLFWCDEGDEMFNDIYNICYNSGKWKKWVREVFDPEKEKEKLIEICGHYIFSDPNFQKYRSERMDEMIRLNIYHKLKELHGIK